ncbi:MAG: hypothetical protein IJY04_06645, partial [Clostridia bacterium]|nr:hypothetical protein [Clostridia bacterium]
GVEMPSSEEISEAINKTGTTVTFAPEKNDEYSWPFIFGTKDGETCLMPSNKEKEDSYSILYATLELKAGQALAFDYFSSTERYNDFMVVLIDRRDIYQISGITDGWFTCYPFVALEDGEYELALCYYKDEDTNEGEDTVYIKNLRVTDTKSIDVETFIPRYAATDEKEDGSGFNSYVEVFYNEKDGYYHVGSVDGPLLLAQLMNSTPFSKTDIFTMAYNGEISLDGTIYYDQLLPYFSMASNSEITGYCPVPAELKELLEIVTQAVGLELDNPDQWLQICSYYSAYGTGGSQLADPTRGLSPESAIPSVETTPDTEEWPNSVTYNRVIMPRGLWYAFTPSRSGAYRITSNSDQEVEGWIFLADKTEYCIYGAEERNWKDETNLTMVTYFEAGTTYYIDIAYTDVYAVGTFTFKIEFIAPTTEIFFLASPGYFTFYENEGGDADTNEIVSGGIDIVFNEDTGYYHELRSDGSIGSILYVDFKIRTNIFDKSLEVMIGLDAFNFSKTEDDQYILNYINKYGKDNVVEKLKELWGDTYDEYADIYNLEDVLAGIYHGNGEDLTDEISAYLDKIVTDESVDHNGCIPVDKELAVLLQALMDKYTFDGVDYSWAKLCYYYKLIAPETAGE